MTDKILFFDTETTGFVQRKLPANHAKQPYTVQLAAVLTDCNGHRLQELNSIIKCPIPIPTESSSVHGITTTTADMFGLPPSVPLRTFYSMWQLSTRTVAHNLAFDLLAMRAYMARYANGAKLEDKEQYCTMHKSTAIVDAKYADGRGGKWPKLEEAYRHFFGKDFDNAHNAMADVNATIDVYFALQKELKDAV